MSRLVTIVLIAIVASTGCARLTGGRPDDSSPESAALELLAKADTQTKSGKYADAVKTYKTVVQNHQNTNWAGTAQYESAVIYLSANNPLKDYAQALAKLDEFITQYPNHDRTMEAKNWRMALKTLLELKRENDHLNKNIERLKQLDMRQEEKRRGR